MSVADVFDHLLGAPPARVAVTDLHAWLARLEDCPFTRPIDRALWAGFAADRLGYAFVGGYGAALAELVGRGENALSASGDAYTWPSAKTRLSLAVTEARGAHPRALETTLRDDRGALVLSGVKTFATLASVADELFVVANRGSEIAGRPQLVVVRVAPNAPGVHIEDRTPTPFAPEIPHARVSLTDVVVSRDAVLPGDGYAAYVKPFRTIEDTHVLGAVLGYLAGASRAHAFARSMTEGVLALAMGLREIARRSPAEPVTHVTLAGLFAAARKLMVDHDAEWDKADACERDRFHRDVGLLMVAQASREQRAIAAWTALDTAP